MDMLHILRWHMDFAATLFLNWAFFPKDCDSKGLRLSFKGFDIIMIGFCINKHTFGILLLSNFSTG